MRKITTGRHVFIESVGVMDTSGAPALPEALEAASALGLDLAAHASQPYTAVDLGRADLVIGFDQDHVAIAAMEGGARIERTFKLLELVRLLDRAAFDPNVDELENARRAIAAAAAVRTTDPRYIPGENMGDPAGRRPAFFHHTAAAIRGSCDAVAARLFGSSPDIEGTGRSHAHRGE